MQLGFDQILDEIARRAARYAVEEFEARNRQQQVVDRKGLMKHFGWSDTTVRRKIKDGMPHMQGRFSIPTVERWLEVKA